MNIIANDRTMRRTMRRIMRPVGEAHKGDASKAFMVWLGHQKLILEGGRMNFLQPMKMISLFLACKPIGNGWTILFAIIKLLNLSLFKAES